MEAVRSPDDAFAHVPDFPYTPHYVDDLADTYGLRLAYYDEGPRQAEHTFLCLHGEPTWSFLYRKMIPPFLASGARVVAPDFFGFGRSDKPVDESVYTFDFHRNALLRLIERLDLERITLVVQDWGGLIGLTLPLDIPGRLTRLIAMNTALGTGDGPIGPGFLAWREYVRTHPDLDIAALMKRSVPELRDDEAAAFAAPYPDARAKAGVRAFPPLVPIDPNADGAALSRRARDWWQREWNALRATIRNAPPPLEVATAGHFVQESGDIVAAAALTAFVR